MFIINYYSAISLNMVKYYRRNNGNSRYIISVKYDTTFFEIKCVDLQVFLSWLNKTFKSLLLSCKRLFRQAKSIISSTLIVEFIVQQQQLYMQFNINAKIGIWLSDKAAITEKTTHVHDDPKFHLLTIHAASHGLYPFK